MSHERAGPAGRPVISNSTSASARCTSSRAGPPQRRRSPIVNSSSASPEDRRQVRGVDRSQGPDRAPLQTGAQPTAHRDRGRQALVSLPRLVAERRDREPLEAGGRADRPGKVRGAEPDQPVDQRLHLEAAEHPQQAGLADGHPQTRDRRLLVP